MIDLKSLLIGIAIGSLLVAMILLFVGTVDIQTEVKFGQSVMLKYSIG